MGTIEGTIGERMLGRGTQTHEMIWCGLAIVDQAEKTRRVSNHKRRRRRGSPHLLLASLTLIRGLARSSLSRWLCSESLRSLSSDMDCFATRPLMVGWACTGVGREVLEGRQAGAVLGLGGTEKAPREEGRSDGEWGEERPAGATTDGGD